jgi:hypothetical protein
MCSRNDLVDDDEEEYVLSKRISKIGLSKNSSSEDQRIAVLWALLASYLPEGLCFSTLQVSKLKLSIYLHILHLFCEADNPYNKYLLNPQFISLVKPYFSNHCKIALVEV